LEGKRFRQKGFSTGTLAARGDFMIRRRKYFKVLALILCFPLTGCMTTKMYDNDRTTYKEKISSVLITRDNLTLVVMGDKYHYIMKDLGNLGSIIKNHSHKKMEAEFSKFHVESNNKIVGSLKISIKSPTYAEYSEALKLGFVKSTDGLILNRELSGTRYLAGNIVPAKKYLLNKQYSIIVSEPEGSARKALKIAATPITVAVDGTVCLAGVSLVLGVVAIVGGIMVVKGGVEAVGKVVD
jgi:hypothetical protein